MYSLLQRFFQNIFHSSQPTLNGAADAAPANALCPRFRLCGYSRNGRHRRSGSRHIGNGFR